MICSRRMNHLQQGWTLVVLKEAMPAVFLYTNELNMTNVLTLHHIVILRNGPLILRFYRFLSGILYHVILIHFMFSRFGGYGNK